MTHTNKIKLTANIPVGKEHGLVAGLELDCEIVGNNEEYWVKSPNTGERVRIFWGREFQFIQNEKTNGPR